MTLLPKSSKEEKFKELIETVNYCRLCSRLCSRRKILSRNNGNIYSNILFIAEAPGRLGADRTLIPMFGDQAGKNFQRLLDTIGWARNEIFITNAVLCNPRNGNGANDTPTKEEIENCSIYLSMTLEIIDPEYVITIGQTALESLKLIENHNVSLKTHLREFIPWYDRLLTPLYHTSPRAMMHRNYFNQLSDFYYIRQSIKKKSPHKDRFTIHTQPSSGKQSALFYGFNQEKIHETIVCIVNRLKKVSKFKLAKLLYLIDLKNIEVHNRLLTNSFYIRLYDGPLTTDFDERLAELEKYEIITLYKNRLPVISSTGKQRFKIKLKEQEIGLIDEILDKYGSYSNRRLKTAAYLTPPMKRILKKEKAGTRMYGQPVFGVCDFNKGRSDLGS